MSAQLILCRSEAERDRAQALFPKSECVYANGETDWHGIEGRDVVAFGAVLAQMAQGYAQKVQRIDAEIPDPPPTEPVKWAKSNIVKSPAPAVAAAPSSRGEAARKAESAAEVPPPADAPQDAGPDNAAAQARTGENPLVGQAGQLSNAESPATAAPHNAGEGDGPPPIDFPPEALQERPEQPRRGYEGPDDWPDPVDWWAGEGGPLPVVSVDMLAPWLADYVFDQSALRGVDPVQPALQCLVAISGALHNSIAMRPKPGEPDYLERGVLWGATVGLPSCKKDAGQAIAVGPLIGLDTEMRRATAKRMQEQGDADALHQDALAAWRKAKGVGPRPEAPPPADQDRLLCDSFTTEGLRSILSHSGRGKVLIIVPELAGMFGAADAYSKSSGPSKDLPLLLRLYESRPLMVDRAAPTPAVYVKSWAASILGGIQPRVLARLITKLHMREDGMLARLLLVVSGLGNEGEERPVDALAASNYKQMMTAAVALNAGAEPCQFSPDAQLVRTEFVKWVYRTTTNNDAMPDGLAAAVGKFEGSFSRLCLTMHAGECAHAHMPAIAPQISAATALRVKTLIKNLLYPHASAFYTTLSPEGSTIYTQRLVAAFILAAGVEKLKLGMCWHSLSAWRHLEERVRRDALRGLCEAGWLRSGHDDSYAVNPAAHRRFPERALIEAAKRKKARDALADRFKRGREVGED